MTETTNRLRLMLTATGDIEDALRAALSLTAMAGFPGLETVWGLRTPGDAIAGSVHRDAIGPDTAGLEALVEIGGAGVGFAELIVALDTLLRPVWPRVDRARSVLTTGVRHLLMPRMGPYMTVFALRPVDGMSREAFFDYWLNRHGRFYVEMSQGRGSYYQLHDDAAASAQAAASLGIGVSDYAGHAGGWMNRLEKMGEVMRHPSAADALEDERRFIRHDRSLYVVYRLAD